MAILFQEESKIITLQTNNSTYQMMVDSYGFLLHLYYGRKTEDQMSYLPVMLDRGFSPNPSDAGSDRTYSMDVLPQEFPCRLSGDFRSSAIETRYEDGSFGCDLRYKSHKIVNGKYSLEGLPACYGRQDEADTLEITLFDKNNQIEVILYYGVFENTDIITRAVKVVNRNESPVYIEKLQSICLDFITGDFDVLSFYGRHAMERNLQRQPLAHGSFSLKSRRGTSSHQYNPLLILANPETTEDFGNCFALSFVYSGGFMAEAEKDQFDQTRVLMGLCDEQFSYKLAKDESLQAPEVIMTYSRMGLSKLSQNLHECIKEHLIRGHYKNEITPILVNSWEASYFDFNKDSLLSLAQNAAELGVEMFVLDDGWFGKRDDDNTGLGDWYVNEDKLGCTLSELIQEINTLGLKFGIWIEPEMVSEDSELYRQHPDWVLCRPHTNPVRGRNQLVLDFSRKEVVDYIFDMICSVLDQGNVEYVKWDMNRSLSEVYSGSTIYQGQVLYRYVLGVYDFLERLMNRYPNLLIEGCSGGGGRFDAGMLYYTPQIWCSDNTDAIDRTLIQYGTSFGYPISAMGAHVSAVPNHQTGRKVSLSTRGVVAMAGTFGYELDLGLLSENEKNEVKEQIITYKKYAHLIRDGKYYRLSNPQKDTVAAWEMISDDHKEVLVSIVMLQMHGNMQPVYVRLKGLCENTRYVNAETGQEYSSQVLEEIGITVVPQLLEYQSWQLHLHIL